jgi:tRNA(Ile)-lysidine synthase
LASIIGRDSARFSIGGGVDVWMRGGILRLSRASADSEARSAPLSILLPGSALWGQTRITAAFELGPGGEMIDFDAVRPTPTSDARPLLWVRPPRDGDRFDPLGLDGHTQGLNHFLRGRGILQEQRKHVPLLCDREGIVWVVGHRISHRVRVTDATRTRLYLRAETLRRA